MGEGREPERELAAWAASLRWADLPDVTRAFITDFFIDSLGSALAGVGVIELAPVRAAVAQLAGEGSSPVIGGGTASLLGAAIINGYLTTAVTACDVHRPTQSHLGPSAVPPALGVAQEAGLGGEQTLTAIAAGLEVASRVAMALRPPVPGQRGWHMPGVAGPFGGAASAAALLGLGEDGMVTALSLAASRAAGINAQWGGPGVKFHQASAAGAGLTAAVLAARGFRAATDVLTRPGTGFLSVYSDGGDPGALTAGLGARYEMERISLRRWPAATPMQPVVSTTLELLGHDGVSAGTVRKLTIFLPPAAYARHGEMSWSTPFTARLSPRYLAAVVLLDRDCWLEQFSPERIAEPEVNRLAEHVVSVTRDEGAPEAGVRLVAELSSGERVEVSETVPLGDPARRLTGPALNDKFLAAAAPVIGDAPAAKVLDRLAGGPDWLVADIMAAISPGSRS